MADVVVGAKLSLDANDSIKSLKQVKTEIKSATGELLLMQQQFGNNSKEAIAAAKRVAELKDQIQEAREVADLFDPGKKFQAFSGAVNSVLGGFTALTGAMGLLGVESENVQKQLLKVQSALALSQGLSQVADSAKDFQRLGTVLVQTLGKNGLIGVAIAGVTALGLALSGVFSKKQRADVQAYNETLEDYNKAAGQARMVVTEVKIAFEQARQGVITKDQALKVYNETLGDSLGKQTDINVAEKVLADKAETYIKITALKAQANALFQKSAEQAAEALIAQDQLLKSGLLDGGSTVSKAADNLQSKIEKVKQDAKDIENIGANLLRQAGSLSAQFNINTGTPAAAKENPKVQAAKAEAYELESIYLRNRDALISLRDAKDKEEEEKQRARIEREKLFDKEAFDAKLALGNSEINFLRQSADEKSKILQAEATAKIKTQELVANSLSVFSDLVGRETAAGKVLAIASATVNTYLAATQALKADYSIYGPAAQFARIAAVVSTIALGLKQVKEIAKVKVPGRSGGGGNVPSGSSVSAPLQPQAPQATRTQLDQDQLNQIGNATVRAFVVESDVTSNQDRIRRLNRAARL